MAGEKKRVDRTRVFFISLGYCGTFIRIMRVQRLTGMIISFIFYGTNDLFFYESQIFFQIKALSKCLSFFKANTYTIYLKHILFIVSFFFFVNYINLSFGCKLIHITNKYFRFILIEIMCSSFIYALRKKFN